MAQFYNALGGSTITGTATLDRYFAFTKDDNFDHVRPDGLIASFAWTTSLVNADGTFFKISGSNVQVSFDVYDPVGGTDVLYGSNLNDAVVYNNGVFADGLGGIDGIQQFYLASGDDIADFSAHGAQGSSYAKQLLIHGEDGNDILVGGANSDDLFGDAGNDTIVGNAGGDNLDGGDGDDILHGDDPGGNLVGGQDILRGKGGNDLLLGGAKGDSLAGGDDDDTLYGGASGDNLSGGEGDDLLYGDDASGGFGDKLYGDDGSDSLYGGGGADLMEGGNGDDLLEGGEGDDSIKGDAGADRLVGGAGNDTINGAADVDTAVFAGNRADYLVGINADGSYQVADTRTGAGGTGSDKVLGVEFISFLDGTIPILQLNHAPVITSSGGGATGAASLDENATFVTTVTATDEDAGQTLAFGLAGGADAALFAIDSVSGALSFVAAPDYENPIDADGNGVYDVVVRAFDGADFDAQALAVTVNDVADGAAPVITSNGGGAAAALKIAENTAPVTTVSASGTGGGAIAYRIVGGADRALFALDAGTGVLRFNSAPDFEAPADAGGNNVYDVVVEASDGANADRQSLAVGVANVNDNAPAITSNGGGAAAAIALSENGTLAATVTASDADASTPAFAPTFSIAGGADAARFAIDTATGALSFLQPPDFEAPTDVGGDNVYEVTVRASDGAAFASQAIGITVGNVNDNAPRILSNGGAASATITLAENRTAVATVAASDADGAVPQYALAGGADAALFTIDAATGVLAFASAPDFENPEDAGRDNRYDVVVSATDGSFVTTQALAVVVTDVAETGRTITGTASNDTITPGAAAALRTTALDDTVFGLAGNDVIDGGTGVDRMEGGAGNDVYTIDTYSDDGRATNDDLAVEQAGGGVDRVNAAVGYRLASEVENLTLLGAASIGGTGNDLDNQIVGNAGANLLKGEGGIDTLLGNEGSDSLHGGAGNDLLVGGAGDDLLFGDDGADKLDGGIGADRMDGGAGDDTFVVDTYSDDANGLNDDTPIELAGGGIDAASASVSYRLADEVENLTLTGTLALDGTGNVLANTITGNNAANRLAGLGGNDAINGLGGDDSLDGGAGSDVLDAGAGNDTLLGGEASDTLKGTAGADVLVGGTGKDLLTGGTEADKFVFGFADTTLNANCDRITDFQASAGDGIDLDLVAGSLAASAYAEGAIGTNALADALALARTLMTATTNVVFIAGTGDGWLFWDGAGHDAQPDQVIQMTGVTSTGLFGEASVV